MTDKDKLFTPKFWLFILIVITILILFLVIIGVMFFNFVRDFIRLFGN